VNTITTHFEVTVNKIGIPRRRRKDNIKMDLSETDCDVDVRGR
jgi:hypothetical protein